MDDEVGDAEIPALTPDECLQAMETHCPTLWDGDGPKVNLISDQWLGATLRCDHGTYRGTSAGWGSHAIAEAFNAALDKFIEGHPAAVA
jgi:hypothetical protein